MDTAADRITESYDDDFAAWAQQQAAFVLAGDWSHLDAANVSEELAALTASQKHSVGRRLAVFVAHVVKLAEMPNHEAAVKWSITIREQGRRIAELLVDSPSLVADVKEAFPTALRRARKDVSKDYNREVESDAAAVWAQLTQSLSDSLDELDGRDARKLHHCLDRLKAMDISG